MTSREAFEAWMNPGKHAGNLSPWVEPGRYEKDSHQLAWLAWKEAYEAGRTAEREACAKVCDTEWNGDADTYEYAEACNECAAAIRARGKP